MALPGAEGPRWGAWGGVAHVPPCHKCSGQALRWGSGRVLRCSGRVHKWDSGHRCRRCNGRVHRCNGRTCHRCSDRVHRWDSVPTCRRCSVPTCLKWAKWASGQPCSNRIFNGPTWRVVQPTWPVPRFRAPACVPRCQALPASTGRALRGCSGPRVWVGSSRAAWVASIVRPEFPVMPVPAWGRGGVRIFPVPVPVACVPVCRAALAA